jgi:hypothetical protein
MRGGLKQFKGASSSHRTHVNMSKIRPLTTLVAARSRDAEGLQETPDATYALVAESQGFFRALPLYAGGIGISATLINRLMSGVAPVVDASSSQSRIDVLGIFMSAVLLLTGLQWLSLKPREMQPVSGCRASSL